MSVLQKQAKEEDRVRAKLAEQEEKREEDKSNWAHRQRVASEILGTHYFPKREKKKKSASLPKINFKYLVYGIVSLGFVVMIAGLAQVGYGQLQELRGSRLVDKEWLPKSTTKEVVSLSEASRSAVQVQEGVEVFVVDMNGEPGRNDTVREFLIEVFELESLAASEFELGIYVDTGVYRMNEFDYQRRFEATYQVVASKGLLPEGDFEHEGVEFSVERVNDSLLSYLEDPKYCESDNDCRIRGDFCTYGAYNAYHMYIDDWVCDEPVRSEEGELFGIYDVELACETQLEFEGTKCVYNECTGLDKEIVCKR